MLFQPLTYSFIKCFHFLRSLLHSSIPNFIVWPYQTSYSIFFLYFFLCFCWPGWVHPCPLTSLRNPTRQVQGHCWTCFRRIFRTFLGQRIVLALPEIVLSQSALFSHPHVISKLYCMLYFVTMKHKRTAAVGDHELTRSKKNIFWYYLNINFNNLYLDCFSHTGNHPPLLQL